ncbi:MAG TPA: VOC family protein [Solirubrobacteraceae bacterium]|nr:VOC family protein [Solirubrobacteraceae bacterium]
MFTGANHLCVVTADLDGAVRRWWDRYRVGPWQVFTYDRSNMEATMDGKPVDFEMRVALAELGPGFRIEIIQPLDDRSLYAAALRDSGGADHLHHVRLDVSDFARAKGDLEALGLAVPFDGTFTGKSRGGDQVRGMYFDATDDLGFLLEIGQAAPGFSMPDPDYVYPRQP